MRYILNSAVLTATGTFTYTLVSADEARGWLDAGPAESAIGYEETANTFGRLLGRTIALDRRQVTMMPGDEALVLRLTTRVPDPATKGVVGVEWIVEHAEMGVLRMIG